MIFYKMAWIAVSLDMCWNSPGKRKKRWFIKKRWVECSWIAGNVLKDVITDILRMRFPDIFRKWIYFFIFLPKSWKVSFYLVFFSNFYQHSREINGKWATRRRLCSNILQTNMSRSYICSISFVMATEAIEPSIVELPHIYPTNARPLKLEYVLDWAIASASPQKWH